MKKKYNIKKEFNLGNNKNNFFVWALLIIVIVSIMQISVGDPSQKLTLSQFDSKLNTGNIEKITCTGHENSNCYGTLSDGGSFSVILPELSSYEERLKIYDFSYEAPTPGFFDYFVNLAPWLLIIGFWFFIMRRMRTLVLVVVEYLILPKVKLKLFLLKIQLQPLKMLQVVMRQSLNYRRLLVF